MPALNENSNQLSSSSSLRKILNRFLNKYTLLILILITVLTGIGSTVFIDKHNTNHHQNTDVKSAQSTSYKIALDLYPQDYAILQNPDAWLQKLTDAYYAYVDLIGKAPYSNQTITMKEFPAAKMSGAEMYAGNPIHWLDSSVPGKLRNINDHNDLSFGPIHELGHDFDITPYSYYYIGSGGTPINAEQWANFKLTYVADTLSPKYPTATFYQSAVNFLPIGDFSKKYFENIFMQEWLASSKSDWKTMKADAYTGFLHSLTRKYGWDMFKKTFRDYQTVTDPLPTDDLQKVNLFVSLLAKNSGADIKQEFINFGIPVSDYTPAPNLAPAGYIFCSYEWDTCSFSGTAQVAFGADGKFKYGTYTNSVSCTVYVFGDPDYGITKACYYKSTSSTTTPTPTSTPSPASTLTPIPTPSNTILSLTIGLDGIGAAGDNANRSNLSASTKNPKRTTRGISVEIYNPNNSLITTKSGNITYDSVTGLFTGTINMGVINTGSYVVKVTSPGYLRRSLPGTINLTSGNTYRADRIDLIAGDINNDNILNILDYNILADCIYTKDKGKVCNQNPSYGINSDLNDNGVKNIYDYGLLLREISVQNGD